MGEQTAHFRATLQVKPSIFEVMAQSSLHNALHPALLKVVQQLSYANIQGSGECLKYYDELFLLADSLLQFYHLHCKNASFSEHFYGLRRTLPGSDSKKLPLKYTALSLVFLTFLPYIERKLNNRIDVYKEEIAHGLIRNNLRKLGKKASIILFNFYKLSWNLLTINQFLQYMSNSSSSPLLYLKLINLNLIYNEQVDDVSFWSAFAQGHFKEATTAFFSHFLTSTLHISAFLIQFLNVWNNEQANYNFKNLPITPPPYVDNQGKQYANRCPICLQKWRIPTVLTVTGYVYCFSCIHKHLHNQPYCPVTKCPASNQDLIRLYDDL